MGLPRLCVVRHRTSSDYKVISFPNNNYKFIKIEIDDKGSLPINILDIGRYVNNSRDTNSMIESLVLDDFKYKIIQDKNNKKTIIKFESDNPQRVNKINFNISTKLYFRNAVLYTQKTRIVKKKRLETYKSEVMNFSFNSNYPSKYELYNFFEKEFYIEIDNQDDQPLQIDKIELIQYPIYILSELNQNKSYSLIIDTNLYSPKYDLENFEQRFENELPIAYVSDMEMMTPNEKNASDIPFWQSEAFLWVCLSIGILIIGYFAVSLLKDMNK